MERKIGEIFEYNGEWYQCVKSDGTCNGCVSKFQSYSFCNGFKECVGKIFKKLEKVGEPYEFDGHLFQSYRTFEVPIFTENYATVRELGNNSKISIEIKQNKEDMEENKLNLKPFDLEAAIQGKPVCTRDGRKARIICFDAEGGKPLIVLSKIDGKEVVLRYTEKGQSDYYHSPTPREDDLMMLPEKGCGYVNVLSDYENRFVDNTIYSTPEEARRNGEDKDYYIATVRIEWEE